LAELEGVRVHGHPEFRLPDNLSIAFEGVDSQALMMSLRDIAVSTGSACMSASAETSHVLRAIGVTDALAKNTLRISLGRPTLEADVNYAMMKLIQKVREFRQIVGGE
jgi:cysteine desulfurase